MTPETTALLAIFTPAIAALFTALMLALRQQRDDWKDLYLAEKKDHKDTLAAAAVTATSNSEALKELADFLHELPRRQEDWSRRNEQRRQ